MLRVFCQYKHNSEYTVRHIFNDATFRYNILTRKSLRSEENKAMNLVDRFLHYVTCPSESGNEATIYSLLEMELLDLGFTVLPCIQPSSKLATPNLFAKLDGDGEPILLVAHMDTVRQNATIVPYIEDGFIWSEGECILGADDKSGIAAIMSAVEEIVSRKVKHLPIEILFTVGEETGLRGSSEAAYKLIQSRRAFVFDSSAAFGTIIVKSPYIAQFHIEVFGKSSHAAIHPEEGINALLIASEIIHALKWGRVSPSCSMNMGLFCAENETNVICDRAEFDVEIRSFLDEEFESRKNDLFNRVSKICSAYCAKFIILQKQIVPGFSCENNASLYSPLMHAFQINQVDSRTDKSFGGSDANMLNQNGIPAVNVSTGMLASHSSNESISVNDLQRLKDVISTLLQLN